MKPLTLLAALAITMSMSSAAGFSDPQPTESGFSQLPTAGSKSLAWAGCHSAAASTMHETTNARRNR